MSRTYETLTLEDAKRMLSAAEAKAASFQIAYNIAVVDAGCHLVAFVRQESNGGNVVIFAGGLPVVRRGHIVGAVGASAGTLEQDIAVAQAAAAALG